MELRKLLAPRSSPYGGVEWRLGGLGLWVDGERPEGTRGEPVTMRRIYKEYGKLIRFWAVHYDVPVELIAATIATETRGDPAATREEPGFISDDVTPHHVSTGLMQTLISTAREALRVDIPEEVINREWLNNPSNSIMAGTAYIKQQEWFTHFHPPMVAAAYNAGRIYEEGSSNRWRMRCYPLNTGHHIDRFVLWFNDCFRI